MSNLHERVMVIRHSFVTTCGDSRKAALFNHILYWIARKAEDQPQEKIQAGEITYYATTEELTEHMENTWKECKVREGVNDLIKMGLIGRSTNPTRKMDRTKHFYFGKEQCAKFLELCQEHDINPLDIGLPTEMVHLINISNANDKYIKCSEHEQMINISVASDKYIEAITKVTTKETKTKVTERKNAPRQKPNIAEEQEASHSSIHSSPHSQNSSSQETKPEEVSLAPEEEAIYDFAKQTIFKAKPPVKTDKLQRECSELAKYIKTFEQFQSLLHFVRALPYIHGQIHLKNLVNELNGWLQVQNVIILTSERKTGRVYSSYDDPDYVDDSFYPSRKGAS